ncbi:FbpB family small basic protein [Oceanobacillus piezotolerans]|uniref:FbpB family small basic protein n=1 Tax=Oceanobacillus piezotolerans TaxID=2448030 RepID=A0A498DBQ7_9BACI|nr:FbpB family small basic protein [Oceanobacillus piezotolerans]RLL45173.1 FbpB family small basic protein [Oceanobacillus piezotolerans]
MRPKTLNYEQLVKQNKQELMEDETSIRQIEMRLEKKHRDLMLNKRKSSNK